MIKTRIQTIWDTLRLIKKHGVPDYILYFGDSLGDNLLLTIVAKALYARGYKNIWIRSAHEIIFHNNPYIKNVLPPGYPISTLVLTKFFHTQIRSLNYGSYSSVTDQDTIPDKHIALKMMENLPIIGNVECVPYVNINAKKLETKNNQILICPSVANAWVPMKNKVWPIENFQSVVDELDKEYSIIQIGGAQDQLLNGVTDLRGENIQDTAKLLAESVLLISYPGFMMHLARAVNCRAVIVYGGREHPSQSGYKAFKNLYSPVHCSPCWQRNRCDYSRICLSIITPEIVVAVAKEEISLLGTKLLSEYLTI